MKRAWVALLAVVLVAATGTGVLVWWLNQHQEPQQTEISVYSDGHLTRVGPYQFCPVLDLDNCARPGVQGELAVNERDAVQLSVPREIARAPWRLLRVYEDPADTTITVHRPNTRLADTIATVDPDRGKLTGIAVQLLTVVQDETGELFEMPHAEWSVATVWP